MRFVIVGAGAVGAVVGVLLARDGHEVSFWVRPSQRANLRQLSVTRAGGTAVSLDSAALLVPGDPVPDCDWVLVCVRGEQLDAALREVVLHFGPSRRVAIAAVSLQPVTEQARAAGLSAPAFALHASFGSHADPEHPGCYVWFPFVPPTTVTPDGDRARMREASELARALAHAGVPARAAASMSATMRVMVAVNSVLALGWDLCAWDLTRLARHAELRRLTARAMQETAGIVLPERSLLRALPAFAFEWVVRGLALFMGRKGRTVWRHHGPKIRGQSDDITRKLLSQAAAKAQPTPALAELFARWQRLA